MSHSDQEHKEPSCQVQKHVDYEQELKKRDQKIVELKEQLLNYKQKDGQRDFSLNGLQESYEKEKDHVYLMEPDDLEDMQRQQEDMQKKLLGKISWLTWILRMAMTFVLMQIGFCLYGMNKLFEPHLIKRGTHNFISEFKAFFAEIIVQLFCLCILSKLWYALRNKQAAGIEKYLCFYIMVYILQSAGGVYANVRQGTNGNKYWTYGKLADTLFNIWFLWYVWQIPTLMHKIKRNEKALIKNDSLTNQDTVCSNWFEENHKSFAQI